ncbi:FadR/GntR family transcriptional regulator [Aidingimonas halophila]|uniref:Transcriptional regulator, GntR family n=1 Tax=Aidingimonas halophila TaxID=574349 RepID=A0A1H2S022_9GAMM|nr:FadR/GntR family transcriptional regulator [Aidingimonas halophila]SDW25026.1 transcriptional regulator, GntR family [Aidingimonas halophila]
MTHSERQPRPDIAEHLAEAIFNGHYEPGDFVPKELDLCENYGVSRSTVRSALQTLVAAGMIKRISGQGSRVTELSEWHLLNPRVSDWMARFARPNPRFQREIFSFRVAVEPFMARLAAENAGAADLLDLETAYHGMVEALNRDDNQYQGISYDEYDIAFHEAIFAATHNVLWSQVSHMLKPAIALLVGTTNQSADELDDSMERHRRLMDAIRLRQPEEAEKAALSVLERTGRDLGMDDPTGQLSVIRWPQALSLPESRNSEC